MRKQKGRRGRSVDSQARSFQRAQAQSRQHTQEELEKMDYLARAPQYDRCTGSRPAEK